MIAMPEFLFYFIMTTVALFGLLFGIGIGVLGKK